jgi:hypothetical protein
MSISTIDPSTPDANEPVGDGDNQIRALKAAIVNQFVGGPGDLYDAPITVGPRAINGLPNKANQSDLTALTSRVSVNELAILSQAAVFTSQGARITALENAGYVTAAASLNASWPIGSVFISYDGSSPTSKGLPGAWERFADGRLLLGAEDPSVNRTAGANQVTVGTANMPSHRHFVAAEHTINPVSGQANATADRAIAREASSDGINPGPSRYRLLRTNIDMEASVGRTNAVGSGEPINFTPAHVKVSFYRRTE